MAKSEDPKSLEGLAGWLILVGLSVIITPLRILFTTIPVFTEFFKNGLWEILTTPGTEAYHPFWSTYLVGEIVLNSGLVIAGLYLIFLFFMKKRNFPKYYIGICVGSLLFLLLDALLIKIVLPNKPMFDLETTKEIARSALVGLIWGSYMLFSKRVKATFIM